MRKDYLATEVYETYHNDIINSKLGSSWEEAEEFYREFLQNRLAGRKYVFRLAAYGEELRIGDVITGSSIGLVENPTLQREMDERVAGVKRKGNVKSVSVTYVTR
jgi:hypothetical protein